VWWMRPDGNAQALSAYLGAARSAPIVPDRDSYIDEDQRHTFKYPLSAPSLGPICVAGPQAAGHQDFDTVLYELPISAERRRGRVVPGAAGQRAPDELGIQIIGSSIGNGIESPQIIATLRNDHPAHLAR
jgi:hypothetical protein